MGLDKVKSKMLQSQIDFISTPPDNKKPLSETRPPLTGDSTIVDGPAPMSSEGQVVMSVGILSPKLQNYKNQMAAAYLRVYKPFPVNDLSKLSGSKSPTNLKRKPSPKKVAPGDMIKEEEGDTPTAAVLTGKPHSDEVVQSLLRQKQKQNKRILKAITGKAVPPPADTEVSSFIK